jgi:hypothetical protein
MNRPLSTQATQSPGRAGELTGFSEQVAALASGRARVKAFRCWVMAALSGAAQEPDEIVSLCGAKDLPEMIEVIYEAERACHAGFREVRQRARQEYCQKDVRDGQRRMGIMVCSERVAWWDGRLKWLMSVRSYLERERDRSAKARRR